MSTIELARNTDDLVVIHRAFRREFGWLPDLVTSTEPLDVRRARRVAAHADDLRHAVLTHVPAPARLRYRLAGIRRYRKEITELYGGSR